MKLLYSIIIISIITNMIIIIMTLNSPSSFINNQNDYLYFHEYRLNALSFVQKIIFYDIIRVLKMCIVQYVFVFLIYFIIPWITNGIAESVFVSRNENILRNLTTILPQLLGTNYVSQKQAQKEILLLLELNHESEKLIFTYFEKEVR